jgi:hypothetical protein
VIVKTAPLSKEILRQLIRFRWVLLGAALTTGVLGFVLARKTPAQYTTRASLFPLTSNNESNLGGSALSGLLGLSDPSKSFSEESGSVNIIELAQSRHVREKVAATRLPEMNNRTIAELIINDHNNHRKPFEQAIVVPADSTQTISLAGVLMKDAITAKMSKNGLFELYFKAHDQQLLTPVSLVIIDRISQFYIELKRQKALADYQFTMGKVDSFDRVVNVASQRVVSQQRNTLFAPPEMMEYRLPQENSNMERNRALRQRDVSANTRDEALWRLQKSTPIVSLLDKPLPPFDMQKPSAFIWSLAGIMAGLLLTALMLISGVLFRYLRAEIRQLLAS